ncbi:Flp pilus assembly protein TadD, contains TPR repeats [Loktanella atrilutea]|uniref:Flp pilus assembly protein TadD, contains TPR repeats n=1 Tax=Loktanella atrilutea TaxID=366533 RepID=A0A1M5F5C5_LOKAT|nr:tetratricopeptide repeat protein [Loktanella atrilutea]SHF86800.1 Flp pilus assembly protein TadD, contains TPR repeats [Loktanella atrilutea]
MAVMILSATLMLTGCKTSEERAEDYYKSGLALLAAGDESRAMIEFRNVFNLDGFHFEARQTYANLLLKQGDVRQAYSQFLRLIEQYPDTLVVRQQLAEIAIDRGDWAEAERHGQAAIDLGPDDPRSQAIAIVLAYRKAMVDGDAVTANAVAENARTLLATQRAAGVTQGNASLIRVDLDNLINGDRTEEAIAAVNAALASDPLSLNLQMIKLQLLSQGTDMAAVGEQLKQMSTLFPDNVDVRQNLVRWYVSQNDNDGAIAYLRNLAGPIDSRETDGHLTVVEFLRATQGPDAARVELTALRDANMGTEAGRLYAGALAALDFKTGATESGIAQMREALDGAPESEKMRQLQVELAKMLDQTGNRDDADTLVTTILAADSSNVEALKLQAGWMISDDKTGDAIVALRRALDQNPQDSQTLTLMAQAHQRDGDMALAGERLAAAVQVSNAAPAESLFYADFLVSRDQVTAAISVLEDARRQAPDNIDVLTSLADLYIKNRDFALAQRTIDDLRQIDSPAAQTAAPLLQAAILQGQNRTADSLAILETQVTPDTVSSDSASVRAVVLILQTQIRAGKIAEARNYLDGLLAASPDDANLAMIDASLSSLEGDIAAAEKKYRALVARFPQSELPAQFLVGLMMADGQIEDAAQVIEAALPVVDNPSTLLLIKAGILEKADRIDEAIAVYEDLYARNSDNIIIANNLASMIASYRDDDESLTRAATISRRLRDTTEPAFADTYGWITFKRGNVDDALPYLELAANGLPDDALVQVHLGLAYAAKGQTKQARTVLTRAVELSAGRTLPQFQTARDTLAGLANAAPQNP